MLEYEVEGFLPLFQPDFVIFLIVSEFHLDVLHDVFDIRLIFHKAYKIIVCTLKLFFVDVLVHINGDGEKQRYMLNLVSIAMCLPIYKTLAKK